MNEAFIDPVLFAQDAGGSCITGGTSLILPLPTHTAVSQPPNKKKLKRPVKSFLLQPMISYRVNPVNQLSDKIGEYSFYNEDSISKVSR